MFAFQRTKKKKSRQQNSNCRHIKKATKYFFLCGAEKNFLCYDTHNRNLKKNWTLLFLFFYFSHKKTSKKVRCDINIFYRTFCALSVQRMWIEIHYYLKIILSLNNWINYLKIDKKNFPSWEDEFFGKNTQKTLHAICPNTTHSFHIAKCRVHNKSRLTFEDLILCKNMHQCVHM